MGTSPFTMSSGSNGRCLGQLGDGDGAGSGKGSARRSGGDAERYAALAEPTFSTVARPVSYPALYRRAKPVAVGIDGVLGLGIAA